MRNSNLVYSVRNVLSMNEFGGRLNNVWLCIWRGQFVTCMTEEVVERKAFHTHFLLEFDINES